MNDDEECWSGNFHAHHMSDSAGEAPSSPSQSYHSCQSQRCSALQDTTPEPFYTHDYERTDDELGEGGCGLVKKVHREGSGTPLAVKRPRSKAKNHMLIHHHEVNFYRKMGSKHADWMPRYEGDGEYCGQPWLLLERLGHSLFTIFCHPEEHDIDTSFLHCARGALACVKALHEQGYIHRDIKGENFVTRIRKEKFQDENSKKDPGVVLLDYGFVMPIPLARCTAHKYYKKFRGTLETASQRQLQQLPLGPADDLESLAYSLLEMYHGKQIWSATALMSKSWFPGYDIPALGKEPRCLKQNRHHKTPCGTNTGMEDTETNTTLNLSQRRAASAPCMLSPLHMPKENKHTQYWRKQRNTINMPMPPIYSSFKADDLKKQKKGAKLTKPSTHQHHPDPPQPSKDVASTKHAGGAVDEITSQVSIQYTRQDLCTISNRRDVEWKLLMEKGYVPPFLISWLKYCRSLSYTDWPDYRYLENLLDSSSGTEVPASIKEPQPKTAIFEEGKSTKLHFQHSSHSHKTLKRDLMTAFDGVKDYEPRLLQAHQKRRLAEE